MEREWSTYSRTAPRRPARLRLDRLMPAFSARFTRSTWPASRTLVRLTAGAPVGSLTRLIVRAAAGGLPDMAACLSRLRSGRQDAPGGSVGDPGVDLVGHRVGELQVGD